MNMFLVYGVGLVALALVLVLPPLLRRRASDPGATGHAIDARRANLKVLREQLAALEADRAAGRLDDAQHAAGRAEIERRVLDEEQEQERPIDTRRAGKTALAMGLVIPLIALLAYALLGSPQALVPQTLARSGGERTLPQIEVMVENLRQRLESHTTAQEGDLQGWTMLANSYAVMQRFGPASAAYARARALNPNSAQLLADHADVLAMLQGERIAGEPAKLITRALQLEPNNLKALMLAGSWAFERGDFAAAIDYWGRAQPMAPVGSDFAAGLANSLQQARAAAAQKGQTVAGAGAQSAAPAAVAPAAAPAVAQAAAPAAAAASGAQISGEVRITDVLAKRVRATDTLFVFARAADGPRIPLAIIRRPANELPFRFTLDDSSAMAPQFRLSGYPQVILGARISPSGDAMPRTGDLMGQLGPLQTGSRDLVLVIDSVVP